MFGIDDSVYIFCGLLYTIYICLYKYTHVALICIYSQKIQWEKKLTCQEDVSFKRNLVTGKS